MASSPIRSYLRRHPRTLRILRIYTDFLERAKSTDHVFVVVVAIIIGVLGGLGAVGFRFLIKLIHRGLWGFWEYSADRVNALPWYHTLFIPAVGGLIVGVIVYFFAREAKGHGVPEVMEAVALRGGMIRPRVVIAKSLASAFTIASGGSVGREGPIVQIGSAIGSTVGQVLMASRRRLRTFVGCGAAAGIAATFNAPVAGALFSVEVILGDFGVPQFSPIVISSVVATVISRHFLGDFPAFLVPKYELVSPWELVPYAALGLIAGLMGVLFIKTLYWSEDAYDRLRIPEYIKPLTGGLVIGAMGLYVPQVFGVGYEAINEALLGHASWAFLLGLVLAKVVATSITIGSGGSGGIFAPSLFMGAMTGGFVGHVMHGLFPAVTAGPGAYALVGMGAFVSATTHAPITAIVIIFELTNDYKIILPLMISCIISTLLAIKIKKESIYTLKLIRRGVDIHQGREVNVLKSLKVREVMRHNEALIPRNMPLSKIMKIVLGSAQTHFWVVGDRGDLEGVLFQQDLRQLMVQYADLKDLVIASDFMHPPAVTVKEGDTLDYVMRQFGRHHMEELPVVSDADPERLAGIISRTDVIAIYNKEIFKRDMADGMASTISSMDRLPHVEVIEGFSMVEMEAPASFVGRTIRGADIRARHGVEVILVKKPKDGDQSNPEFENIVPSSSYVFEAGDHLLLFGEKEKLERVSKL